MKTHPLHATIVCATDFSANGQAAATVAAVLAARRKMPLVLVHALNLGSVLLVGADERRVAIEVGETRLKHEADRLRSTGAALETVLLPDGWAAEALREFVRISAPALVVVSSRRLSALDRWASGSVSDEIAQHAACPTLLVREAEPFVKWAAGESRLRVFAAVDFGGCTETMLRWIGQLSAIGPCELTVCHVNWKLEEPRLGEGQGVTLDAENPPAVQARLERDVRTRVHDVLGDAAATIVVKAAWGAPEAALIEEAEARRAEVIVVGAHQWHGLAWLWHGSVSRAVMHRAGISVVCVPAGAVTVEQAVGKSSVGITKPGASRAAAQA